MSFIAEIRRRNVFKVAIAYAAVSWLLIQIALTVEDALILPPWFGTFVIVTLAIGFPVAVILAWAFELTPDGIKATVRVEPEASITQKTGRTLNHVIIGVLAIAVVFLLIDRFALDDGDVNSDAFAEENDSFGPVSAGEPGVVSTEEVSQTQILPDSIAVIPFISLSSRQEDDNFAIAFHGDVIDRLTLLSNMNAIWQTTMLSYSNTTKTPQEIADELGVEYVLTGTLQFVGDQIAFAAQLYDGPTGELLARFEDPARPFRDYFAIQAEFAMNLANRIDVAFSNEERQAIEDVPTTSVEAHKLYLDSRHLIGQGFSLSFIDPAIERLQRATDIDPTYVDAWVLRSEANYLASMLNYPNNANNVAEMRLATEQALALDPLDPGARSLNARRLYGNRDLKNAYLEIRGARELAGRPVNVEILQALGYFGESVVELNEALEFDRFNPNIYMFLMRAHTALGNDEEVRRIYEEGSQLFRNWPGPGTFFSFLLGAADDQEIVEFAAESLDPRLAEMLQDRETLPARLHTLLEENPNDPLFTGIADTLAAYAGDPELAWERRIVPYSTRIVGMWMPISREVRQLQAFKDFLRESGHIEAWQEHGWPEQFCEPLGENDFRCF